MRTGLFILDIIINAIVLLGTSLFPFVVGMLFYKNLIISRIRKRVKRKNITALFIILFCFFSHVIVKNMIMAPFISFIFIIAFSLIDFSSFFQKILLFLGKHSTNIWLVHMQFYMIFLPSVVFCTQTVLGCLIILLLLSVLTSYIVNFIENNIVYRIIK